MKPMTQEEKMTAYYKVASDLIDYVWNCADRGIVPLKHDANVYLNRLTDAHMAKRIGGTR